MEDVDVQQHGGRVEQGETALDAARSHLRRYRAHQDVDALSSFPPPTTHVRRAPYQYVLEIPVPVHDRR